MTHKQNHDAPCLHTLNLPQPCHDIVCKLHFGEKAIMHTLLELLLDDTIYRL